MTHSVTVPLRDVPWNKEVKKANSNSTKILSHNMDFFKHF